MCASSYNMSSFDAGSGSDIPDVYGDNRIVLMIRDPWTIFSYWETNSDVERGVRDDIKEKGLEVAKSVLRVYDVTGGQEPRVSFEFELKDQAKDWYIHTGGEGKECGNNPDPCEPTVNDGPSASYKINYSRW